MSDSIEKLKIPDGLYLTVGALLNAKNYRGKNLEIRDSAIKAQIRSEWRAALWVEQASDEDLQDLIDKMRNAKAKADDAAPQERAVLIAGSEIAPERIEWVWSGYLALAKVHLIAGAPGTGKTTLALGFAAAITCGGKFPGGADAAVGNVVLWSGEDGVADTLVPRLLAMGADMTRIHIVQGIVGRNGAAAFDPARDMDLLRNAVMALPDVKLLIVDPIVSAVAADNNKNADVRRALQPLVDLSVERRCATIGITHLSKGTQGREPVERVTGSVAFGALARIVLFAARQHTDEDAPPKPRLLLRAKSNIGLDGGGFEYELALASIPDHPELDAVSTVRWGAAVQGDARSLLAAAEPQHDDRPAPRREEAIAFLRELLQAGPVESVEIYQRAEAAGFSKDTIKRARHGAQSRDGGAMFRVAKRSDGKWVWSLLF